MTLGDRPELLGRYSKTPPPISVKTPPPRPRRKPARPRVHEIRRRLSDEVIGRLVADYESGCSTTALMRDYQLGKGTVLGLLAEHGVKMRGQGIPGDRLQEAIDHYTSGLSLKQVAAQLDCSAETVRQALLEAGVEMRPRWQRNLH